MPALDVSVLARLRADIGGDDASMRELADAFFSQSPRLLDDARRNTAPAEHQRLMRAVHTLKSSAVTFGALRLAQLARELEQEALHGPVRDAGARVDALAAEYARVEGELRHWMAHGHQK